jgi:hypothetical protein
MPLARTLQVTAPSRGNSMRAMPRAATKLPTIALAAALSCTIVAHQPGSVRAATDGFVTREEALRIVQTPLENTIGRAEADRVQRVAVANAMLEHCRLDWERLFRGNCSTPSLDGRGKWGGHEALDVTTGALIQAADGAAPRPGFPIAC